MSLNWQEIDLIIEELDLEGAFIQKIRQPNYHSILFDIYSPGKGRYPLLIELNSSGCRINRLYEGTPYRKAVKLQRFAQLLRSRVQGGRIISAGQLGAERIVRLELSKAEIKTTLYIRLWSNAANIIATESDSKILDAFYRRPNKSEVSGALFHVQPAEITDKARMRFPVRESYRAVAQKMSFNEFIDSDYETETTERMAESLLSQAILALQGELAQIEMQRDKKQKERTKLSSYETNKHYGDLLAAFRHTIVAHEQWVTVYDYDNDNQEIRIRLDPKKSPGENIEAYYNSFHKSKGAYERLEEELILLDTRAHKIEKELAEIKGSEETTERFLSYLRSIISRTATTKSSSDQRQDVPGLQFLSGIYTIYAGRTAKENDALLRKWTRGNDYWMHTRDYPGGYVFIKYIAGKSVPLETILDAGNLALYYSKARNGRKADLYYTQVKHLRRAKSGKLGTVLPTHEKNISIELDQSRLDRLFTGGSTHE